MAKRFIDTDLFKKPFIRSLEAPYKALWVYLLCECDHAGIWSVELDVAQLRMGMKLDPEKALEKMGGAVVSIEGGTKWYLPDFIAFQYGTLNPANRVHESVLSLLSKHGIDPNDTSQKKDLVSPLQGAKDKEKDKDKDRDLDKAKEERARDERFEALWVVFERHGSKGKALTYWGRLSEEDKVAIEAKAPEYVRSTPGAEYRKHLDGWINPDERRWEAPVVFKVVPIAKPVDITYAQAKQELEAIRASRGIAPGGYIESHLIPAHISKAMQRG